jgi:hypothetical protein
MFPAPECFFRNVPIQAASLNQQEMETFDQIVISTEGRNLITSYYLVLERAFCRLRNVFLEMFQFRLQA